MFLLNFIAQNSYHQYYQTCIYTLHDWYSQMNEIDIEQWPIIFARRSTINVSIRLSFTEIVLCSKLSHKRGTLNMAQKFVIGLTCKMMIYFEHALSHLFQCLNKLQQSL
jgi:hypothetical protein